MQFRNKYCNTCTFMNMLIRIPLSTISCTSIIFCHDITYILEYIPLKTSCYFNI